MWYRMIEEEVRAMLICPRGETADYVYHGMAIIIIIIRVARCNDRIRQPIPRTALR